MNEAAPTEKLHKVLANLGHGSRRQVEEMIRKGKVRVDGEQAAIGMRVSPSQRIAVRDREVSREPVSRRVVVYNKPPGEDVSRAPQGGRPSVYSALPDPKSGKWLNIGRLDVDTEGLLLFTNDGELAHLLSHPSAKLERCYRARVDGRLAPDKLREIGGGMAMVGERPAAVARISLDRERGGRNVWYRIAVLEGRNRIVRRIFEAYGLSVSRLIRTEFGTVQLPEDLGRGEWTELGRKAIDRLEGEALTAKNSPVPRPAGEKHSGAQSAGA